MAWVSVVTPVRLLLEYEASTQCHRLVDETEAEILLDTDVYERIYGQKKGVREDMELMKELRRLMGDPSMEELAPAFGVHQTTISQWFRGKNAMRWRNRETMESLLAEHRRRRGVTKSSGAGK
ncbi:helix-turn-helix domain-containing protein [Chloroflexota bacterium]